MKQNNKNIQFEYLNNEVNIVVSKIEKQIQEDKKLNEKTTIYKDIIWDWMDMNREEQDYLLNNVKKSLQNKGYNCSSNEIYYITINY